MCLCPKYITNRKLHWNLFEPVKLHVPCGKCEECKQMGRSDWFVRSYFEWLKSRESTYFYTLTYNNEHLPTFDGIACFNKKDLQDFLKRLRNRLSPLGISLKYLITCEFGELRNRSHYHALFFLSENINAFWLKKMIAEAWQKGFVKEGQNYGLVSSDLGISYVTKYITKDCEHVEKVLPLLAPRVFARYYRLYNYVCNRFNIRPLASFKMNSDFSFSRQLFGKCSDEDLEFVQKFLTKIRRQVNRYTPFHLQSTKLGVNMVDKVCDVLEQVPVLKSKGQIQMYRIPRYIKRLLWYDCVEGENSHKKDTFILNEKGKKHLFEKIEMQVLHDIENYRFLLVNSSSNVENDILPILKNSGFEFKHARDVVHWCQHFDLDLETLSIYKNVFRGRCDFVGYDGLTEQYIKDSWRDVLDYHLHAVPNMDFGEIYKDSKLVQNLSSILWNRTELFQPYEQALTILDTLQLQQKKYAVAAKLEKDRNARRLRDYINNYY